MISLRYDALARPICAAAIGILLLASCAPLSTTVTASASTQEAFDGRLRTLSVNPAVQRAVQHRFHAISGDPAAFASALGAGSESPESVRSALLGEVGGVVSAAFLVSSGPMGAWTACDPQSDETVNIPVSDIPELVAGSQGTLGIYRLRDHRHLMLLRPVVVDGETVGAVGLVLTEKYEDPLLVAAAVQLD